MPPLRALIEQAAHVEDLRNSRRSDAPARPSAPASARASFLRRNIASMTDPGKLETIYEEIMNLRDAALNQGLPANQEALDAAHREIMDLRAQNNTLRAETYTQQRIREAVGLDEASAHSPARQPIYVVAVTQQRDPLNIGSTESCLRLMRELEQMPMDNETVLDPESICGYLREIVRLRRGTAALHDYLSHHGSLTEAIEHANMDNERDMLEVWRMEPPAALATGHLSYRDPKLVARRRPRDGFEHWHVFDKNEAKRFERVHNIGAQNQEVRDEEEI